MGLNSRQGIAFVVAASFLLIGVVLLSIGGAGYDLTRKKNAHFTATECTVVDQRVEGTDAEWQLCYDGYCIPYDCNCYDCNPYECDCYEDDYGQEWCYTCWDECCDTCYGYDSCCDWDWIPYIKYRPVWDTVFPTSTDTCPDPSFATLRDVAYQTTSGPYATDDSRDRALELLDKRLLDSVFVCFYDTKTCAGIVTSLTNPNNFLAVLSRLTSKTAACSGGSIQKS